MTRTELVYPMEGKNQRLDLFVAEEIADLTRSAAQRLIEAGLVTVDGILQKASLKLRGGEVVVVNVPPPVPAALTAEEIPLEVLHEDADVIVINKPSGMVVHPGAGNFTGTLVNALLARCEDLSGIGGEIRPGIVHRIDKDTSGILVVAKSDRAHQALGRQFKAHTVNRVYTALVYGCPAKEKGKIESAIGRHPVDRKKMSGSTRRGRHAVTHWKVLRRYRGICLLQLTLETGRTHQIRVHLSEAGHPLVGDQVYGSQGRLNNISDPVLRKLVKQLGRQALHAGKLGFVHPVTGSYLEFVAPVPEDMSSVIRHLDETCGELPESTEQQ